MFGKDRQIENAISPWMRVELGDYLPQRFESGWVFLRKVIVVVSPRFLLRKGERGE